MKKVEVEVSDEEYKDLEEFNEHHPELKLDTPGKALKHMAGLKGYRTMKKMTDPKREKPSITVQDLGIPSVIPCALAEALKMLKMSYVEYLELSSKMVEYVARQAKDDSKKAQDIFSALLFKVTDDEDPEEYKST